VITKKTETLGDVEEKEEKEGRRERDVWGRREKARSEKRKYTLFI
jgi:hypothetical protein